MLGSTADNLAWAFTRFVFGASLSFFHGFGKVFEGKIEGLTKTVETLGFPAPTFFAWAASLTELVGGILIAVGLLTRPAAALAAFTMIVALYRHRVDEFARMEMALMYLSVFVLAVVFGGGRYSLDRVIGWKGPKRSSLL